jgi:hypothetical protein
MHDDDIHAPTHRRLLQSLRYAPPGANTQWYSDDQRTYNDATLMKRSPALAYQLRPQIRYNSALRRLHAPHNTATVNAT